MLDIVVRPRPIARRANRQRAARPILEGLEDRLLLYATTGDKFEYGSRITWSIVPDGTNLGGVTSTFNQKMNNDIGAGQWEQAVEDAFAQWENITGVNFVEVGDNGEPTGSDPYQQGSPNVGDIRIAAYPQAPGILAFTLLPPPANGGSDSGDIFLNTSIPWSTNASGYDLETVLVHEIGHALGMGHSADPNAVMYPYYGGINPYPDLDDIQGVDSIWGARPEDGIAKGCGNFTYTKAANITKFINGANDQIVLPSQDVASDSENYWFQVTTPANASKTFSVTIQSTVLSELSPSVWIYNNNPTPGVLVKVAASPQAYGATITASISNATPNTTYLIRVGGTGGADGDGAYAMTVNMGNSAVAPVAPPNTMVAAQPDQGGGGSYDKTDGARFGGANNASNTPVDLPDQISIAGGIVPGDFLVIGKDPARTSPPPVHINVPHPVVSFLDFLPDGLAKKPKAGQT